LGVTTTSRQKNRPTHDKNRPTREKVVFVKKMSPPYDMDRKISKYQKYFMDWKDFQFCYFIFRWFGVELDEPIGRHDGTVQDIRYFAAPDDHGVFVAESKLTKIRNPKMSKIVQLEMDDNQTNTFSMNYHTLEDSLDGTSTVVQADTRARSKSPKLEHKPRPLRRSLSMQHRASKV
jgi:hypothetical protein